MIQGVLKYLYEVHTYVPENHYFIYNQDSTRVGKTIATETNVSPAAAK